MAVADALAAEIAETSFEELSTAAVANMRRAVLDTIGVAFFGYALNPATPRLLALARELGGGMRQSTLIGDGARIALPVAAAANAELSSNTDFDETGPGVHALSKLVQTGVAVAEHVGASGRDLLAALILAYEVNGRFARAAFPLGLIHGELPPRDTSFPGHHRHYGASVAIVASRLLGLTREQTRNAISLGWRYTAPFDQSVGAKVTGAGGLGVGGAFHFGACIWGIHASLLARNGIDAPDGFIETERRYDTAELIAPPSPTYYTECELHLKPWIVSRGVHPAIAGALEIARTERLAAEEIDEIRFIAKNEYIHHPFTVTAPSGYVELINSVPWAFARALLGYEPGPAWLSEECRSDPRVAELAAKVRIEELDRANEIWFSGVWITNEAPNRVVVRAGERTFERLLTYGDAPGSTLNPMSDEWVARKFEANTQPALGRAARRELLERLSALDDEPDMSAITRLYRSRRRRASAEGA